SRSGQVIANHTGKADSRVFYGRSRPDPYLWHMEIGKRHILYLQIRRGFANRNKADIKNFQSNLADNAAMLTHRVQTGRYALDKGHLNHNQQSYQLRTRALNLLAGTAQEIKRHEGEKGPSGEK